MYIFSIFLAKIIFKLINTFKIGSGYTWPGHLVLKIYPKVINKIAKSLPNKVIFISGTNGKTTTSKLVKHLLESQGYRVLHNETGANLLNGIVSTALLSSSFNGDLNYDYAVFEVDESTLPSLLDNIKTDVVALLNLSRDQLDRYWEVDLVLDRWYEAFSELENKPVLVLDKFEEKFKSFEKLNFNEILYFDDSSYYLEKTRMYGSFNAKNINCALLIIEALGLNKKDVISSLAGFETAYGRGEEIKHQEKAFHIYLAKNPASLNQNLEVLVNEFVDYDTLLFVLNDSIPDGGDVSWIYDVLPEGILNASSNKEIFVSGVRAYDMAVRLQYAGIDISLNNVDTDLRKIISKMIKREACKEIIILPNYSAMLEVRKVLTGKSIL